MHEYDVDNLVHSLINHLENKQEKEIIRLLDKHPFLLNHSLAAQDPTVFHYAALCENYAVIDYLVLEKQVDIHQVDKYGENAMFYAKDMKMMKKLYDIGVSINQVDIHGCSLLMMSAQRNSVNSFKFLIEHEADVNHENNSRISLLSILETGHHPIDFSFLMKHLEQFNEKNQKRLKKLRLKELFERSSV